MDREAQDSNEIEDHITDGLEEILDLHGTEQDSWRIVMENWQRQRDMCVIQLICYIVYALHLLNRQASSGSSGLSFQVKEDKRRDFLKELRNHEVSCRATLRMGVDAFAIFCEKLPGTGVLQDYNRATVEEQVARFLSILTQTGGKYRNLAFYYRRSIGTVSRHFHNVLRAVISLAPQFLKQPSATTPVSSIIGSNSRFFPYFKDCIGAIDGTHFRVKVNRASQTRFRGRKEWTTQNVLASCNFDLQFLYVLAGWEGTASDSRILKDALARPHGLVIPEGKFYLGDGGLMLRASLLTPYRRVRYHLKEYSRNGPKNAKELFNHRHASLRNSIERCFGVVKKRFPIIGTGMEPQYSFGTTTDIILACCIIHNFLMGVDPDEQLIAEVDRELERVQRQNELQCEEATRAGLELRDSIAEHMWHDYNMQQGSTMSKRTKGKQTIVGETSTKENLQWTEEMDTALLESLLAEQHKGNGQEGMFTTHAYNNVVIALRGLFSHNFDKEKIKNRQKTVKKHFATVKDLFHNMSGFAWNPVTKLFEAEPEVWKQLIQEKPNASRWIRTPINNYDKLFELYGEFRATGEGAASAFERIERWNMRSPAFDIDLNNMSGDDEGMNAYIPSPFTPREGTNAYSSDGRSSFTPDPPPSVDSHGTTSSKGTKRKAPMVDVSANQFEVMAVNMSRMASGIEKGNVIAERSAKAMEKGNEIKERSLVILDHHKTHIYKEGEIFQELQRYDIPGEMRLNGYKYLEKNPDTTRALFGLPEEYRQQFIVDLAKKQTFWQVDF
ncbi:unnamed protein product [Linum trigynum]|uniref:Transposase n=1 Tax=Linum trigynum TaxID=586398 RepID=A0AAV2ES33_9ROSI